jgi:hypothetical protein
MIKQFFENIKLGWEVNNVRNQLQKQLLVQAEQSLRPLQEATNSSGITEHRDAQQAGVPGSHDDFFQLPSTEREMIDVLQKLQIVAQSPFAKNILENRINYILGDGFTYTAEATQDDLEEQVEKVQGVVDQFLKKNKWFMRQQEIIRRQDRDGEAFLRFFPVSKDDGFIQVRFLDPQFVVHPENSNNPLWSWGILTTEEDVEEVIAYHIDNRANTSRSKVVTETIEASEVQHRKLNVDEARKRGFSTLGPIRKNIERTDVILRNAGAVTTIQSAIAMIRKHASTGQRVEKAVNAASIGTSATGVRQMYYPPGSILDATSGTTYEMPATGVDPTKITGILQAELRAMGSAVQMPEFMISGDASNANYSSTLVSEGPFVRSIQRLQRSAIVQDTEVIDIVLAQAVEEGVLNEETLEVVKVKIEAPDLVVRDFKELADIVKVLTDSKIMSKKRAARKFDIEDFEAEQEQIEIEDSLLGDMVAQNPLGF